MKWIYVIILVAIVGVTLSNEKLRSFVFSSNTSTSATSTESSGGSSRVGEMDAASEMSRNAGR